MAITVEINGERVSVPEGWTIMQAANRLGVAIPHFCYHEKLSVAANCRMCMVEVEKAPKAVPACATPVMDGMVVRVNSAKAKQAQHSVMEFLLINHPLDCPVCDQGGECQLQDMAVGYGLSGSRYQEEKRVVFEKNLGPLIATDMTRCIHCTRCVRFGREVAGIMELGMIGRGEHSEIMPFVERTVDSEISGNMIDICPVGALTSKPFRFSARPWELERRHSVGTHDSWGSHLLVQVKSGTADGAAAATVKRVLPDRTPPIAEHWISDRDRFSYEGLGSGARAVSPLAKQKGENVLKESAWQKSLRFVAKRLTDTVSEWGAESVGFFVSPRASCEEAFLLQKIARHLGCGNVDSRLYQQDFSAADVVGLGVSRPSDVSSALFVGADPARELPLLPAYFRRRRAGKKLMSLSVLDVSAQLRLAEQALVRPAYLARAMVELGAAAGLEPPAGWREKVAREGLFVQSEGDERQFERMVAHLKAAGDKGVIWLGDIARAHAQYGVIVFMARRLAAATGARVGTLADLGNGVGVRQAGAVPAEGGRNVAQMLGCGSRAAVMFRCEPADFAERRRAAAMLGAADFVCAMSGFRDEAKGFADVLLPTAEFAETDGTYVNGFGQAARVAACVPAPGKAKPGWKILRLLGEYLEVPGFDFVELADVADSCRVEVEVPVVSDEVEAARVATATGGGAGVATPVTTAASVGDGVAPVAAVGAVNTAAVIPPGADEKDISRFSLYGGRGLYNADVLVRHSPALQATRQGKGAQYLWLNSADLAAAGLQAGEPVVVNGGELETTVYADERLARGVARCHALDGSANGGMVSVMSAESAEKAEKAEQASAARERERRLA